ncbi:MAG: hypothetical protein ACRDYZ_15580 [Acidimicrobiales bacterium]
MRLRAIPSRLATGAFILHSGIEKLRVDAERATALHGMAAGAYPNLQGLSPQRFVRALALAEIAVGAALLVPLVGDRLAGLALSAFSGALVLMYWRTPRMRKSGSVWPTQAGLPLSKDVWMLGIGLGLVVGG